MGMSNVKRIPCDTIITECRCGRNKAVDKTDLAVILEEDFKKYIGWGKSSNPVSLPAKTAKVVCLRPECSGAWRSCKVYVQKLVRIPYANYVELKLLRHKK